MYVPREESFTIPIDVTSTADTTVGTLMEIENCQIRGQVSQDLLH